MSDNSTIFTGSSRYSSDLQQVLNRSIAIASLPLTQLNNQLSALRSRSAALDSVNGKFAALLTALEGVSSATVSTSPQVSDDAVLGATSDSTALPGVYSVHVVTAGSANKTISSTGLPAVQDPSTQSITSASSLTLTVGGTPITITPAANTLNALADAINSSGANVTATIVNLGPPSAPDYKLSVQGTKLGNIAIQLNDGSQNLLTTLSTGTEAQYQVNGLPASPVSSDSSIVTIAPGLNVELRTAGDATVTVSRSSSAQASAISSFVAAFNAAVDELSLNRGQGGGALTGDPLISTLSQALRNLGGFSGGSGPIQNLTDLGLTFDRTGKLSFDQTVFDSASAAHASDVRAFLGTSSSGGFLKAATDILNSLEDPIDGTIGSARDSAQTAIDKQNDRIADQQSRIEILRTSLIARMSAADALIASLEQQVSYFTTLFTSLNGTQNR